MLIINGKMMLKVDNQIINPGEKKDLPEKVAESLVKVGLAKKVNEKATMPKAENAMMPSIDGMTKNQLVRELNMRGIEHNKRQVKDELIALLRGD